MASGSIKGKTQPSVVFTQTNSTYNVTTTVYANEYCCTVGVLRNNGSVTSTGWTSVATIPSEYCPKTTINIATIDSNDKRIPMEVQIDGTVRLWSITNGQVNGRVTYPL